MTLGATLYQIRFPVMDPKKFALEVGKARLFPYFLAKKGYLSSEDLSEIFAFIHTKETSKNLFFSPYKRNVKPARANVIKLSSQEIASKALQ